MSGRLASSVLKSSLTPALKPVAVALALHGSDAGDRIWPSVALLAWELGKTERMIQLHLSELRALGVLIPISRTRVNKHGQIEPVGGAGLSVQYQMVVPPPRPWPPPSDPQNGEADFTVPSGGKGEADFTVSRSKRVKVLQKTVKPVSQNGEVGFTRSVNEPLLEPLVRTRVHAAVPVQISDARQGFEAFWDAYPRKENPADAWYEWQRLGPDCVLLARMVAALEWQRVKPGWIREGGRFIPEPAKWLRKRRWMDTPSTTPAVSDRTAMLDRAMKGFLSS